ncbi:MAG: hypothetical protein WDO16_18135 [Bacteroidota bacterium]
MPSTSVSRTEVFQRHPFFDLAVLPVRADDTLTVVAGQGGILVRTWAKAKKGASKIIPGNSRDIFSISFFSFILLFFINYNMILLRPDGNDLS